MDFFCAAMFIESRVIAIIQATSFFMASAAKELVAVPDNTDSLSILE